MPWARASRLLVLTEFFRGLSETLFEDFGEVSGRIESGFPRDFRYPEARVGQHFLRLGQPDFGDEFGHRQIDIGSELVVQLRSADSHMMSKRINIEIHVLYVVNDEIRQILDEYFLPVVQGGDVVKTDDFLEMGLDVLLVLENVVNPDPQFLRIERLFQICISAAFQTDYLLLLGSALAQ